MLGFVKGLERVYWEFSLIALYLGLGACLVEWTSCMNYGMHALSGQHRGFPARIAVQDNGYGRLPKRALVLREEFYFGLFFVVCKNGGGSARSPEKVA